MQKMTTLPVFSAEEAKRAKVFLATQAATMMGRKLEEGDWGHVYCKAKGIPGSGWSNLHIDVNYMGLGVEHKLLRCAQLNGRPLKSVCGTSLIDLLRKSVSGQAARRPFGPVLGSAVQIRLNPASMLTRPAMMEVLV